MWAWRAMVMMKPSGDNSWLVHQISLAVLPAETSGASRRNGRKSENFAYQYLKYLKGSLTCCKILRHGTTGFTSLRRKVYCGFLSPLIHRLCRVWTRYPWVQWQAHYPLHHQGYCIYLVQTVLWLTEPNRSHSCLKSKHYFCSTL
jgi:hypothetical protein